MEKKSSAVSFHLTNVLYIMSYLLNIPCGAYCVLLDSLNLCKTKQYSYYYESTVAITSLYTEDDL